MPRIYVGTYAKYNAGSIAGQWLDLEDYSDRNAFLEACHELHRGEHDPELMFQDFEGFPREFYSESSAPPAALWDWLELNENDRELLTVYKEHVNQDGDFDEARDVFAGKFDSKEDWAAQFLEDTGTLESIPENLRAYFDYEAYARDVEYGGDMHFVRHDGEVWAFHRN